MVILLYLAEFLVDTNALGARNSHGVKTQKTTIKLRKIFINVEQYAAEFETCKRAKAELYAVE